MGQDIGTTIVKLTGGEGLGLGLEPTELIQGSSLARPTPPPDFYLQCYG